MKNEKYRLDVKKSSLRSLVKAHEHLVAGLLHASTAVLREVETISPVSDIREFIRQAQVPWQAHEPMVPTLHGNALLATELKTFEKMPQPKLSRALSSLSIRTATIAPTDDSNNKTAALQDKVLAAEAEKEDSFGHSDLQKNFNVVPIIEIAIVEKKNTALVVPNGMEVRDECVQAILQLQQIKKQTQDILAPELTTTLSETPSDDPTIAFMPAATTTLDLVEELAILSQDYDTVVDQLVLPFSVDVAFTQFWQPTTFLTTLLESCGETLVNVGSWHSNETSYAAFDRLEQFQAVRTVAYTHNKKYMVGPSSIPTVQKQRLKYDKANGCLVLTVTTTVTDAPYHDYFRAESRWVFSTAATHSPNECRLDTGVRLHWIKNTWLKKQRPSRKKP
ncbi:hypothetical protein DYB31_009337 [Aphanomyces astaci]|uniref:VASt domain-containing protein n=2 Tax=Aphanomyces astaci TaxID=112090 RepID=A0A397FU46_APHAT|nr:hypothetical protein DYB31_009337 [Aphanomyces astaci]